MARPGETEGVTPEDDDPALVAAFNALPRSRWATETVQRDHDVLVAARARVADAYDTFDEVIVSFSGGKDSTALLGVAADEAVRRGVPCRVLFFDEEAIPYDVEDYVRRLLARPELDVQWLCLPVQHRNACTSDEPNWWPWEPESRELWCRPLPPESRSEDHDPPEWWPTGAGRDGRPSIPVCSSLYAATRPGTVCFLLGLRGEESMRRRSTSRRRGGPDAHVTHQTANGARNLWMSYPIYDWTVADVWTAIGTLHDSRRRLPPPSGRLRGPPGASRIPGRGIPSR
jgi:predicted phosphoadenosine phosphosulfate sulfurtransferase